MAQRKRSRKQRNQPRHTQSGRRSRLRFEQLEQRQLLSANPTLVLITHGFDPLSLNGADVQPWQNDMAGKIATALWQDASPRPECASSPLGPSDWNINGVSGTSDVIAVVNWRAGSLLDLSGYHAYADAFRGGLLIIPQAQQLADSIQNFLNQNSNDQQWNLLFIGHSRGGFFDNQVIKDLQTVVDNGQCARPNYVETIMLDPTGVNSFGDFLSDPSSTPPLVNWSINYDDAQTLVWTQTQDHLTVIPGSSQSAHANEQPGSGLDVYLSEHTLQFHFPVSSWNSHSAFPYWYESGALFRDLETFVTNATAATSPEPSPYLPLAGDKPIWPSDRTSDPGDDYPQAIGSLATALHVDGAIVGNIEHDGDRDCFQVHVLQDGNLNAQATPIGKTLNAFVMIYDAGGNLLAYDGGHGASQSANSHVSVHVGETYYIEVAGLAGSTGGYKLSVTQPTSIPPDPVTVTPPPRIFHDSAGGVFADARFIAVDKSNKGDDAGQISPSDDVDLYWFTANTTGKVEIDISPKNGLTTFVTLYDAQKDANGDGKPDGVDTSASDNDDGFSHFLYDVVAGGTYYVGIASKVHASTGGYELHIRAFDPNTAPGHSGTDTTPQPLTDWGGRLKAPHINLNSGNGSSCGFIGDPGETEWFEIDGAQAGNMLVTVAGVNDDLKEFVTAFRSNGGGIDSDNGEFDGTAQVGFTVASGERIYVAVSSLEGKYTGGYTITVSQPSTLPSDDFPNFGQTPRYLDAEVTPGSSGGDGYIKGKIERTDDNDWFRIPVRGTGYMVVQVEASNGSDLTPFIELNRDGTSGGFFESDDGRDGSAQIGILPTTSDIWVKVSGLDGTQGSYTLRTWRSPNPDDDHPDSGGAYAAPLKLAEHGSITVSGRIEYPSDKDCFRVLLDQAGPVVVEIISLTEGFTPFLHDAWQTPNHQGDQNTDGGSGRGGRTFHIIPNIMPSPDNWVNIDISGSGANRMATTCYMSGNPRVQQTWIRTQLGCRPRRSCLMELEAAASPAVPMAAIRHPR